MAKINSVEASSCHRMMGQRSRLYSLWFTTTGLR